MSDLFAIGWVLGFSIGIGVVTFTVTRRALRARGPHSLEDEDAAEDGDTADEEPSPRSNLQTWIPFLVGDRCC
jgi:hypothetical protein